MRSLAALLVLLVPSVAIAQAMGPQDDPKGVDATRYQRALSLVDGAPGPWALDTARHAFGLRAARIAVGGNSGLPNVREEGVAWSGRGMNLSTSALAGGKFGVLTVRLEPVIWWAQNVAFPLVTPATGTAPFPFSDPLRPRTIDLPQRMGETALARLEPGESEVAVVWFGVRAALTSAGRDLGTGTYHSLIMQRDAGGFPRLEIGTGEPISTPVGAFSAVLASGRLAQTPLAPEVRTGARHGSFLQGRWLPFGDDRLELGGSRFYHRDWQGIRAKDLLVPFGSFFFDEQRGGGDPDNQLLELFLNVRLRRFGAEFFAEFGRNDRAVDLRDLAVELDHNTAWLIGFQKAWQDDQERLWTVNLTGVTGRIPSTDVFRPQPTFYQHRPIRQGHTSRGQLLGTSLLERTGGGEVRIDRYDSRGRNALIFATRALPNQPGVAIGPDFLRQEWSAWLESLRFTSSGSYFARVGAIADVGRDPVRGDSYSLSVSVGYTHRR